MTDRRSRGVLDTSVVIAMESARLEDLPVESVISAVTLAELAVGPLAARGASERAGRLELLQRAESSFGILSLDAAVARAYGRVYTAVAEAGRKPRGRRALDLLIAATALAHQLPLYTRNADDFAALDGLVSLVAVPS